jgi:hypothetical protein
MGKIREATMTNIRPVLTDPSPEALRRRELEIAERMAGRDRRLTERFERLLNGNRCPICNAGSEVARIERCKRASHDGL